MSPSNNLTTPRFYRLTKATPLSPGRAGIRHHHGVLPVMELLTALALLGLWRLNESLGKDLDYVEE